MYIHIFAIVVVSFTLLFSIASQANDEQVNEEPIKFIINQTTPKGFEFIDQRICMKDVNVLYSH